MQTQAQNFYPQPGDDNAENKRALCQKLDQLHTQINELAMSLSTNSSPEIHQIWLDLANARAFISSALSNAREIKAGRLGKTGLDWQI